MTTLNRNALVPYTTTEMFALVNDIESYPQFLPWCRSTQVHSRDQDNVYATIELAQGVIHKSFTTHNRLQQNKMIEMRLVKGPFRHLEGLWRFDPIGEVGEGCRVSLAMEFEFSNRVISLALGPIFNEIVASLVDAFCKRARDYYGQR
ncbi:cyclase/dehydrase [Candidatus Nitrosoglobus terrae]|uniref:Cyclase/dehydrase n=1 Tax=Candidatus Nitrosoglobus terrae TaxID=1630141 RepID=A0A1Q2SNS9_9GAMM|nr:type II toxin-antitoxin system RatA family toxin [Candidatus Nitrosoglobus terrae]BAW80798.1 cyclase/dehydrase [Candidatus Nitrosoglobus terrae]